MTDEIDSGREAWERQQSRLSNDAMGWYREKLSDPAFQRDHPEAFAALSESVTRAISASGQSLDTAPDGRSTAQQVHDARFGVAYTDGKITLPANLQTAIDNDGGADPHDAAQTLGAIGLNYKATYEAAARLLEQCGVKVSAATLSAHTLSQLAIYAAHTLRHQKGRPS